MGINAGFYSKKAPRPVFFCNLKEGPAVLFVTITLIY